jgi:hypothetical protein
MKKYISAGWDSPTTAQFRRDIAAMSDSSIQGTMLWAQAKGDFPKSVNGTPHREAFSRDHWKREWFTDAINDLQAAQKIPTTVTDNFLGIYTNPGNVDWFDDEGWKEIADHFGIAAWIAKQGGIKGLCFDAEPYKPPFVPFDYKAQLHADKYSFDAYFDKVRQRGRETMRAMKAEFPDMTVLTLFLTSYLVEPNIHLGPGIPRQGRDPKRAMFLNGYGLYHAFLMGWLDEIPPKMRLVDGNEEAYYYDKPETFFNIARRIKSEGALIFPPELRTKYKKQVQVGSALYLDAHKHGLTKPELEQADPTPAMLEKNARAALSSSDEYVWFYHEHGRFWPEARECSEWPGKEVMPPWETVMPGLTSALSNAQKYPIAPVFPAPPQKTRIPALKDARRMATGKPNLLKNGDFATGPLPGKEALPGASSDWGDAGAPTHWNYWQADVSKGRFDWDAAKKAARIQGVRYGTYLQTIETTPGERYLLRARSQRIGTGLSSLTVQFKTAGTKNSEPAWLPITTRYLEIQPVREVSSMGGKNETFEIAFEAPPGAGVIVVLLNIHGQPTTKDTIWWEKVELFKIA